MCSPEPVRSDPKAQSQELESPEHCPVWHHQQQQILKVQKIKSVRRKMEVISRNKYNLKHNKDRTSGIEVASWKWTLGSSYPTVGCIPVSGYTSGLSPEALQPNFPPHDPFREGSFGSRITASEHAAAHLPPRRSEASLCPVHQNRVQGRRTPSSHPVAPWGKGTSVPGFGTSKCRCSASVSCPLVGGAPVPAR